MGRDGAARGTFLKLSQNLASFGSTTEAGIGVAEGGEIGRVAVRNDHRLFQFGDSLARATAVLVAQAEKMVCKNRGPGPSGEDSLQFFNRAVVLASDEEGGTQTGALGRGRVEVSGALGGSDGLWIAVRGSQENGILPIGLGIVGVERKSPLVLLLGAPPVPIEAKPDRG